MSGIEKNAPQLDAEIFLKSGATQIRQILTEMHQMDALDAVLQAYVDGLTHCYWITTACAIAAFCVVCGLEWKSVKKGHGQEKDKNKEKDVEAASGEKEKEDEEVTVKEE